jgi:sugar lactone lactonase YvrE
MNKKLSFYSLLKTTGRYCHLFCRKGLYLIAPLVFMELMAATDVQAQIITTIAGNGIGTGTSTGSYSGDGGPAIMAGLNAPLEVAVDVYGNIYFADYQNQRVRRVDHAGIITTIAGGGIPILLPIGDGGPATASLLDNPDGVALDGADNLYICEQDGNRLRKVNAAGIITTFAGPGSGPLGDGGPATAATLNQPYEIASDIAGNVYILDGLHGRVRKVDVAGIITTVAGNGTYGYSGDGGPATTAQFSWLSGVTVDALGNLFITDQGNGTIRKVSATGIISTIAGAGVMGYSGDGGPATTAQLSKPNGIVADAVGNVYFNDAGNNRLRIINTYGIISTIAGTGVKGYSGDGGLASAAQLNFNGGLAIDCGRNLFIADAYNQRIRKITYTHAPYFPGEAHNLSVCENSGAVSVDALLSAKDTDVAQTINWSAIVAPAHGTVGGLVYGMVTTGGMVTPSGITYTPTTGYSGMDSFRVAVTLCGYLADTVTIYVTINPLPVVANITGKDSICMGKTITFSDATASGVWSATGGASVSATGTVTGTTAGAGTVSYTVTTLGCSTAVGYAVTVVNCPNEVKPLTPKGEPAIWPNPVKDELMVSNAAGSEVTIYNIMGQQISFDKLMMTSNGVMMTSDKQVVNIKGLVPGTYIVRVTGNGWVRNLRVVKE